MLDKNEHVFEQQQTWAALAGRSSQRKLHTEFSAAPTPALRGALRYMVLQALGAVNMGNCCRADLGWFEEEKGGNGKPFRKGSGSQTLPIRDFWKSEALTNLQKSSTLEKGKEQGVKPTLLSYERIVVWSPTEVRQGTEDLKLADSLTVKKS